MTFEVLREKINLHTVSVYFLPYFHLRIFLPYHIHTCSYIITVLVNMQLSFIFQFTYHRIFINTIFVTTIFYFLKHFIYLFLERGRKGEREGVKHQCVVASSTPPTGCSLQPRHVPCLGIEPATPWFSGPHSVH